MHFQVKQYFQIPKSVDDRIPTPVECGKIIKEKTNMDSTAARTLGERVNDHLRYKLVALRVQKALNFFIQPKQPLKDEIAQYVRRCGWVDVARIVDRTSVLWNASPPVSGKRSTRNMPLEEPANVRCRGVDMNFCTSTSKISSRSKVLEFVSNQLWPFLQVSVNFKFSDVKISN